MGLYLTKLYFCGLKNGKRNFMEKNQREKRVYVNGSDFAVKTKWDKNI